METVYKVKTRTIKLKSITDKIKIWCFGDVHRFTRSCDEDRWKWFLKCAKEQMDENTYFFGMGDYCEFASSKEQKALHSVGLHECTIIDFDDIVKKRNRVLSQELSFMKPNLLGLIDGNHNWVFKDGRTATEDLAERLGAEYLGWLCHFTLRIEFNYSEKSTKYKNIYFILCHGKAGGRTEGATLNQLSELKQIFPIADFYIMGHDHNRFAKPTDILIPNDRLKGDDVDMKQKRQFLCRSGSFKKAYTPDTSGYEIGRLLKPADLGALRLEVGFHRDEKDGRDILVTDTNALI